MVSFASALAVLACLALAQAATPVSDECIAPGIVVSGANVFPPTVQISSPTASTANGITQVKVAKNFEVTYYPNFKVVSNLYQPFWGDLREKFVLYPCGLEAPDLSAYPELKDAKVFEVPLKSVAIADTTALAFMKALNIRDRVKYATTYAVDPCMQTLVSPTGCNRAYSRNMVNLDGKFNGNVNKTDKTSIVFTGYADPGALNKAEYIKYIAPFFNREHQANAYFDRVKSNYDTLKTAAGKVAGAKPLVAWIYFQPGNPVWKTNDTVIMYGNQLRKDFMSDAGGQVLDLVKLQAELAKGEFASDVKMSGDNLELTTPAVTLPLLRTILKGVAVLVDETSYNTVDADGSTTQKKPADITLSDFLTQFAFSEDDLSSADFPFLRDEKVLRLDAQSNAKGDIAWFEDAVANPDAVLQDMVYYVHPSLLPATAKPVYLKSLFDPKRVTLLSSSSCPLQGCALPSRTICPPVHKACDGSLAATTADTMPCTPTCPVKEDEKPVTDNSKGAAGKPVAGAFLVAVMALLGSFLAMGML